MTKFALDLALTQDMKLSEVNREGEKKRGGLLVSTNTISVTIDLHSLICSVLSLSVSVSAAMAMASASEGCVGPQFNGREGMASQGGLMMRDWKGSCIFRDAASHTTTCFSSGRALAVLAKDGAVLAPRWRSSPAIQARRVVRATPLWAKLGDPVCLESEPGQTTRWAASPMKLQGLMAAGRSEPGAERTSSPGYLFHFPQQTPASRTPVPPHTDAWPQDANSLFGEHVVQVSFIAQSLLLFSCG